MTHDGKILFFCHAGCKTPEILAALGMRIADIMEGGNVGDLRRRELELVDVYPYEDEHGEVCYEVLRYMPKTFRQRRPDHAGGWIWNLDGVRLVPYRLPKVLASKETLVICEGERDVHTAELLGFVATTNNGGACHWNDSISPHFAGKSVVVIPDNDAKGREHAYRVCGSLLAHGVGEVRLLQLPGLPEKADLTSWCRRVPGKSKSLEERRALVREALLGLIGGALAYRAG